MLGIGPLRGGHVLSELIVEFKFLDSAVGTKQVPGTLRSV